MITRATLLEQVAQAARDKAHLAQAVAQWQVACGIEQHALFLLDQLDTAEAADKKAGAANAEAMAKLKAALSGRSSSEAALDNGHAKSCGSKCNDQEGGAVN